MESFLGWQSDSLGTFCYGSLNSTSSIEISEEIGLPSIVKELIRRPRGLFIVTGPTGSGKTTTLATMVDFINDNLERHIMTVEDSGLPNPVPVAFLLCDQIPIDAATKKKTIVGVFDRIWARQFPAGHGPISLFIRVIDCEGEYSVRIEYVQVSNQSVLAKVEGTKLLRMMLVN